MDEAPEFREPWKAFRCCPDCGSKGITLRADRSVQCKRCGYHLYLNTAAAVAGIIEDDVGRFLMTVRAKDPKAGMLDLPGGFLDPEETAEDGLVREVREELNLEVNRCSLRYLGSFPNTYSFDGIRYATLDMAFVCTVESFAPQKLSDEISSVQFFRPSEVRDDLIGFDSIRAVVAAYMKAKIARK